MLVSNRDIPLVTQDNKGRLMLTVENYIKWYNLFLIKGDGTVETVEWNIHFEQGWRDHCIVPSSFKAMAEMLHASYDEETWKAVCEMYEDYIS